MNNEWRDEKLSSFDHYFQNNKNIDKMIHQNESVVHVFADQKSTVLKKFDDEKIWWWKNLMMWNLKFRDDDETTWKNRVVVIK